MNKKFISKALTLSVIAGASYYSGYYFGKRELLPNKSETEKSGLFCAAPNAFKDVSLRTGLPIFSTVSAATVVPRGTPAPEEYKKLSRVSQIMKYGYPGMDQILSYSDFVISYDRRNRVPHWVLEHLTPESVRKNPKVDRSNCNFTADPNVHIFFRSDNSDYKRSGYDRGHMAAAGNHRLDQKHCDETFFLSNMAPQVGEGFNRDSWNRLEQYVRKLTKDHSNVYVCTGPLYLPRKENDGKMYVKYEVIGSNTVAVPTHFYKVIVAEAADHRFEVEAYVMPNQKIDNQTPLKLFQVRPEVIERSAGLLFFNNLQKNNVSTVNGKKV